MKKVLSLLVFTLTSYNVAALEDHPTGVSTTAISLPEAAGTISGIGENAKTVGNTGAFSYSIKIEVPKGINKLKPTLSLSYNSNASNGEFGQGWSLNLPSISRSTLQGTPRYSGKDIFTTGEGDLVKIYKTNGINQFYAPFINSNQSQYEYDEDNQSWIHHRADGHKFFYGILSISKIENEKGTYKWFLEKEVDTYQNEIVYEYEKFSSYPYLKYVKYAFKNSAAKYYVEFNYTDRDDSIISYKSNFKTQITKKCSNIFVKSDTNKIIRSYNLQYSTPAETKVSILSSVKPYGIDGLDTIPAFPKTIFSYNDINLVSPISQKVAFDDTYTFPPSLKKSRATFVDINRDALPDIIETSPYGAKVWINAGDNSYKEHYEMPEFISMLGTSKTKLIDVDGDRIVDFVATGLYPKFFKGGYDDGSGEIKFESTPSDITSIPRFEIGAQNLKTIDLNGDGRLDMLAREPDNFKVFMSTSSGSWDGTKTLDLNTSAFDISSKYTFYEDMNGDGLVDIVIMKLEDLVYLPSMGDGRFDEPVVFNFNEKAPLVLKLAHNKNNVFITDINSDGRGDILVAYHDGFSYSLNQGNGSFSKTLKFDGIHSGEFNKKGMHITTADMNGNGSTDIVWSNDFHDIRYFDLMTKKANVISEINNGLGLKTKVSYKASTAYSLSSDALVNDMASAQLTVNEISEYHWNESSPRKRQMFRYFGGYYDGDANEVRGFNLIESINLGDESVASKVTRSFFEQGRSTEMSHNRSQTTKVEVREINSDTFEFGEIFKQDDMTLSSIETFESLEDRLVKIPFVSQKITTEGDNDPLTSSSSKLDTTSISLGSNNYISKSVNTEYLDMLEVNKTVEKTYASILADTNMIANRVCKVDTFNKLGELSKSENYYYDQLSNLCETNKGSITEAKMFDGTSYFTKGSYSYKSFGALESFTDSLNNTTTINYESFDIFPLSVLNAAGHTKFITYDYETAKPIQTIDENSLVTKYFFDTFLRLNKLVGPSDSEVLPTIEVEYQFATSSTDPSSILTKKREKSGLAETFDSIQFIDAKARSIGTIEEGEANRFIYSGAVEYNSADKEYKKYLPSFVDSFTYSQINTQTPKSVTHYDILDREVLIYNPEHTQVNPSFKEVVYKTKKVQRFDELSKETVELKDSLGQITKLIDADLSEINYTWDEKGNLLSITDPLGQITKFEYDLLNRRTCKLDSNIGLMKYEYNTEDLITKKSNYGYVIGQNDCQTPMVIPRVVEFKYNDPLNRKTLVDFPAGSNTSDISFVYDEASKSNSKGKLTTVYFEAGSKSFDYDIFGNIKKEGLSTSTGSYEIQNIFDVLGRIEKTVYPTINSKSLSIDYVYSKSSSIVKVKNTQSGLEYVKDIVTNPLKLTTQTTYGNDVVTNMQYDDIDFSYRLKNINTTSPVSVLNILKSPLKSYKANFLSTIQNISYEYDNTSNVLSRSDAINNFNETYGYDDLHRITSADLGGLENRSWIYDEIGNIDSRDIGLLSTDYQYETNRKQILKQVGSNIYSFDVYGNLTSDGSRTFNFNFDNRPISIDKSGILTSYTYDEAGIRVEKTTPSTHTVFIGKGTELRGTKLIRHIFAGGTRVASVDDNNVVTYNHQDHLKSSNIRTDESGNIVKKIEYNPFGSTRSEVGTYDEIKNRYTDQYYDEESELYYYNQRYYDPALGRFISADPLYSEEMNERGFTTQEINLYAYTLNNPLKYIDPTGESIILSALGLSGLIVAGGEMIVSLIKHDTKQMETSNDLGKALDVASGKNPNANMGGDSYSSYRENNIEGISGLSNSVGRKMFDFTQGVKLDAVSAKAKAMIKSADATMDLKSTGTKTIENMDNARLMNDTMNTGTEILNNDSSGVENEEE